MDTIQKIMDETYDRWNATAETKMWTQQQFWDQLSDLERMAVYLCNMNYQVENGGWSQWIGNGYATLETVTVIHNTLQEMDSGLARKVYIMVQTMWNAVCDDEEDEDEEATSVMAIDQKMSSKYYKINTAFMTEFEVFMKNKVAAV